ncbi:hypothetical protein ID866_7113, partial [Astraeus odoratus]
MYFVTTMWDEVDENIAEERLNELEENYWRMMIQEGSKVERYWNTQWSAIDILRKVAREVAVQHWDTRAETARNAEGLALLPTTTDSGHDAGGSGAETSIAPIIAISPGESTSIPEIRGQTLLDRPDFMPDQDANDGLNVVPSPNADLLSATTNVGRPGLSPTIGDVDSDVEGSGADPLTVPIITIYPEESTSIPKISEETLPNGLNSMSDPGGNDAVDVVPSLNTNLLAPREGTLPSPSSGTTYYSILYEDPIPVLSDVVTNDVVI